MSTVHFFKRSCNFFLKARSSFFLTWCFLFLNIFGTELIFLGSIKCLTFFFWLVEGAEDSSISSHNMERSIFSTLLSFVTLTSFKASLMKLNWPIFLLGFLRSWIRFFNFTAFVFNSSTKSFLFFSLKNILWLLKYAKVLASSLIHKANICLKNCI